MKLTEVYLDMLFSKQIFNKLILMKKKNFVINIFPIMLFMGVPNHLKL